MPFIINDEDAIITGTHLYIVTAIHPQNDDYTVSMMFTSLKTAKITFNEYAVNPYGLYRDVILYHCSFSEDYEYKVDTHVVARSQMLDPTAFYNIYDPYGHPFVDVDVRCNNNNPAETDTEDGTEVEAAPDQEAVVIDPIMNQWLGQGNAVGITIAADGAAITTTTGGLVTNFQQNWTAGNAFTELEDLLNEEEAAQADFDPADWLGFDPAVWLENEFNIGQPISLNENEDILFALVWNYLLDSVDSFHQEKYATQQATDQDMADYFIGLMGMILLGWSQADNPNEYPSIIQKAFESSYHIALPTFQTVEFPEAADAFLACFGNDNGNVIESKVSQHWNSSMIEMTLPMPGAVDGLLSIAGKFRPFFFGGSVFQFLLPGDITAVVSRTPLQPCFLTAENSPLFNLDIVNDDGVVMYSNLSLCEEDCVEIINAISELGGNIEQAMNNLFGDQPLTAEPLATEAFQALEVDDNF